MMALLAKTLIVCAIPKVVDTIYDFFMVPEKPNTPAPKGATIRKSVLPPEYTQEIPAFSPDEKMIVTPANIIGGNTIRKSEATDAARYTTAMKQDEFILRPKIYHKKHDHSVFTQAHFDLIVEAHAMHLQHNIAHPEDRRTVHDLRDQLNDIFGFDKGVTSYSRVYLGKVSRSSLPTGTSDGTVLRF